MMYMWCHRRIVLLLPRFYQALRMAQLNPAVEPFPQVYKKSLLVTASVYSLQLGLLLQLFYARMIIVKLRLAQTITRSVRLYDISAQRRPVMSITFRESPIKAITEDLDGNTLYIGTGSGDLASFDMRTGKLLGCFIGKCSGSIRSITRHPTLPLIISCAARLRVAANEKAEAEKIVQIKRAEGEAEAKYLSGQAIVDGLRDSVLDFSVNVPGTGTTAKDVMDMVLVTQYFDTMKEIGASLKSSAVFIPQGPGAVRDVAAQIRDGLLQTSTV